MVDTTGSDFTAYVSVYVGSSVSGLSRVIEDAGNPFRALVFQAVSGTEYQIGVEGWDLGDVGNIVLNLHYLPPVVPPNDDFANRIEIVGMTVSVTGSSEGATAEPGEPSHSPDPLAPPAEFSLWWKWRASVNGWVSLDTIGSSVVPDLAVYTGTSVSHLMAVARRSHGEELRFFGVADTEYEIAIDGHRAAMIVLTLQQFEEQRSNDEFGDRFTMTGLVDAVVAHNGTATKEDGEPLHAGDAGGHSLWWSWTAPTNGWVTLDTVGSSFDTLLAVYTGELVTQLSLVQSNDDRGFDRTSSLVFPCEEGVTYQFAVDGWNGAVGNIQLSLQCAPAPINDLFAKRLVLTETAYLFEWNTDGATREPGEPASAFAGSGSVWWQWTAARVGNVQVNASTGHEVRAYTGQSLGTLNPVAGGPGNFETANGTGYVFAGMAGTTYDIALYGYSGTALLELVQQDPARPAIEAGPLPQTAAFGYPVTFGVTATGTLPLFYQWQKDGVDLPGASNATYLVASAQPEAAGAYQVIVNNSLGRATSAVATLTLALPLTVGPFAGGGIGSTDGPGAEARFNDPRELAVDQEGNIYVADSGNHTIRKITPAGVVSTFAGTAGSRGTEDGDQISARFDGPAGVGVDQVGQVYVADQNNHTIRKISSSGIVGTLAGVAGDPGLSDGLGSAARFSAPSDLTVDSLGVIYVVDGFSRIRKITPDGLVFTLASDLGGLTGLAVDSEGNVFVTDSSNDRILKITPFGLVSTFIENVVFPRDLAMGSNGELFVSTGQPLIQKITANAVIFTVAGWEQSFSPANGVGPYGRFQSPDALALDGAGNLYVVDAGRIRKALTEETALLLQPASRAVLEGETVQFLVEISCAGPVSFQWYRNDTAITDATNRFLTIPRVRLEDAGNYRVTVMSGAGALVSSNALLTVAQAAANDLFANRALLTGRTNSVIGHNIGAGLEPAEPRHAIGIIGNSVWWSWTAPTNGEVTIDTIGSSFDTVLAIYTGSSFGSLRRVINDDDGSSNGTSVVTFSARAGTTYQIAVAGQRGGHGTVVLSVRQPLPTTPPPFLVNFAGNWPGGLSGPAMDVKVVGTFAYVALGQGGFAIHEVSEPAAPRLLGSLNTPGEAISLAVSGTHVYLVDRPAGLFVIDIQNPAAPKVVGWNNALTDLNDVLVQDGYAYLADRGLGLRVFDVSNPANLTEVAGISGQADYLTFNGNLLYFAAPGAGLRIARLDGPTNLVVVGEYAEASGPIALKGDYAYVCHGTFLRILNVADVRSPLLVRDYDFNVDGTQRGTDVALRGNRAYLTVLGRESSFLLQLDLTDPLAPRLLRADGTGDTALALSLPDGYAFVAAGAAGVQIFDLDALNDRVPRIPTFAVVYNLAVQGNYAYLATGLGGLQVLDLSNPGAPLLVLTSSDSAFSVAAMGSTLFVNEGPGRLVCFDLSDPRTLRRVSSTLTPFLVGLTASGNRLYGMSPGFYEFLFTPDQNFLRPIRRLEVFDVTDRERPISIRFEDQQGSGPAPGFSVDSRDLLLAGGYGFLAGEGSALVTLDLTATGRFRTPSVVEATALDLEGNLLALGGAAGLELFDISNLTKPFSLGHTNHPVTDLAIHGNRVVVVEKGRGLEVLEITSTGQFTSLGSYDAPGFEKFALAGNYAMIAHGDQGLTILDLGPALATAPAVTHSPRPIRALPGRTVHFDVGANGTVPMFYQWRKNGTNIPGATNFVFNLAGAESSQVGNYSVAISNAVGVTISSNAPLSIDQPPQIVWLSPVMHQVLLTGHDLPLAAQAQDPDGELARVDFYEGANLLGSVTGAAMTSNHHALFIWTNVAPGTYALTARAWDNEGASSSSSPVTVLVTTNAFLQIAQPDYEIRESEETVRVTIRRNRREPATVKFATLPGTAREVRADGLGDYFATNGVVSFAANQTEATINIAIVNDSVYRNKMGMVSFRFEISEPSAGWNLAYPSNSVIRIIDDEPSTAGSSPAVVFPGPAPSGRGALTVSVEPLNPPGKWRFAWETSWRDVGSVSNLVTGDYFVVFMPRAGFVTPAPLLKPIGTGADEQAVGIYSTPTNGSVLGSMTMHLYPLSVTNRAAWRLADGQDDWHESGAILSLPAGLHLVEFKAVDDFTAPPVQEVVVSSATLLSYAATYFRAPSSIPSAPAGPIRLPSFTALTNGLAGGRPYAFNGQLLSAVGAGSGFVVKPHTVLTVARMVFDPTSFSHVGNIWWSFQRHRGEFEPVPLRPRGWYVFGGYAAQRSNDLALSSEPGAPSVAAQGLDVAALYFREPAHDVVADRFGAGGFLTSDTDTNWLANPTTEKLLIGYPVEHVPEGDRGKMHRVGPDLFAFEALSPRVYRSDDFQSYPGNQGGPLCVRTVDTQSREFYIPAGVYLGDSGESTVRIIDLDVADLIHRAERSGAEGGGQSGGGVIQLGELPRLAIDRDRILILNGRIGTTYRVEYSTSLGPGQSWTPWSTNLLNNEIERLPGLTNHSQLFFRALVVGP